MKPDYVLDLEKRVEEHRSMNKILQANHSASMVDINNLETLLKEREEIITLLEDAKTLFKRRPKVTNSMYVGTDTVSWGRQVLLWIRRSAP